jgi:hypothetical protein
MAGLDIGRDQSSNVGAVLKLVLKALLAACFSYLRIALLITFRGDQCNFRF